MSQNEDTRVKLPAILHLCRLGFSYLSLKNQEWDKTTNIFPELFNASIQRINPTAEADGIARLIPKIATLLDYEDLGKAFYERLHDSNGIRLIDFDNFERNSFHVVTELPCKNKDEEFRPDITLLINGMPLVFIEVKKPNNRGGMQAEDTRAQMRFQNKAFRRFINITQLMVYSNNMEYDDESLEPINGAFYAIPTEKAVNLQTFREENHNQINAQLQPHKEDIENELLTDTNYPVIKHNPEFALNKSADTPTNRLLTSLFTPSRLAFFLQFGIAYLEETNKEGLKVPKKQVMRYPQFFALLAIEEKLRAGVRKGVIWHTQGSGKTALAYYATRYLNQRFADIFKNQNLLPKFYFVVDRLDLMIQAKNEFSNRGLSVQEVSSREDFRKHLQAQKTTHNHSGNDEITVVNIQKFQEEANATTANDYGIGIQRIYFLDEAHRSYNPTGSFLANLITTDKNAIMIGLTGTPLISKDYKTKEIFGDYIHRYYYNASIRDGFTLRLMREGVETQYKELIAQALKDHEILKGELVKKQISCHPQYITPLCDFIHADFTKSRLTLNDATIGGMIVCDSSDQAKAIFSTLNSRQDPHLTLALILHDVGDKQTRKSEIENFKEGKIDIVVVYNMLLTGFDAPRLKKMYLARLVRDHNLLQTLTRVNRPYTNPHGKKHRFGFVVDFADIRKNFDQANNDYLKELNADLAQDEQYSGILLTKAEIEALIDNISEKLFSFDLTNLEAFSQQINHIDDKDKMREIVKALELAGQMHNVIRYFGYDDLSIKLDFSKLRQFCTEAENRLCNLRLKASLEAGTGNADIINQAIEQVLFDFKKLTPEELKIADELQDNIRKARERLGGNFDKADPEYVKLYDEFKRLFFQGKINEIENLPENIRTLEEILRKINEINRQNNNLKAKYQGDEKIVRVHKRIVERGDISQSLISINQSLLATKAFADSMVINSAQYVENEGYFYQEILPKTIESFESNRINLENKSAEFINVLLVKEYQQQYRQNSQPTLI